MDGATEQIHKINFPYNEWYSDDEMPIIWEILNNLKSKLLLDKDGDVFEVLKFKIKSKKIVKKRLLRGKVFTTRHSIESITIILNGERRELQNLSLTAAGVYNLHECRKRFKRMNEGLKSFKREIVLIEDKNVRM